MLVDIICLANSHKMGGRCVAGIRVDDGSWIRLVAPDTEHGQLLQRHTTLDDGSDPRVLDVIRLELAKPLPLPGQPENWEITGRPWKLRQRPASRDFADLIFRSIAPGSMILGSHGSRLHQSLALETARSLTLVAPPAPRWFLQRDRGKRLQPRVSFEIEGQPYDLPLTDPAWTARVIRNLSRRAAGSYPQETVGIPKGNVVILTISLSEPFYRYCYKLVAGVIALRTSR
jgi:hypothetical protein